MLRWINVLTALLLGAVLLGGAFRPAAPPAPSTVRPEPGYLAPELDLLTPAGAPVRLSDYQGRAVFLNFWASWCGPCRLEMPDIQRLARELPEGTAVLTVNATDTERTPADPVTYMRSAGYDFPVVNDPAGRVQRTYRVLSFPTTLFIGPDGVVRRRVAGPLTHTAMVAELAAARAPAPPAPPGALGRPALPEVLALGDLRLATGALFLLLGVAAAALLARPGLRRRGLAPGLAADVLTGAAVAALVGSKLAAVLMEPAAYLARPQLLLAQGSGAATLLGGVAGALAWLAWDLRRAPARPLLDALAAPVLAGAAVAAVSLHGLGAAALLAAAAAVTALADRHGAPAGHAALFGLAAGAAAALLAGLAYPAIATLGGLTAGQWLAAALGLGALAWLRYKAKQVSNI